jgi:hypothetical protein
MWLRPQCDFVKLTQGMGKFDRWVLELLHKASQVIYKQKTESM